MVRCLAHGVVYQAEVTIVDISQSWLLGAMAYCRYVLRSSWRERITNDQETYMMLYLPSKRSFVALFCYRGLSFRKMSCRS